MRARFHFSLAFLTALVITSNANAESAVEAADCSAAARPVLRDVVPTEAHFDYAWGTYGPDAFYPGYDDIQFVEFDIAYLLERIALTPAYQVANRTGNTEHTPDRNTVDLWLNAFGHQIPLTITRLSIRETTVEGIALRFVNASGVITDNPCSPHKNPPAPLGWTLTIEQGLGIVVGEITTYDFRIGFQYTLDRAATFAFIASHETLSLFLPID